MLLAGMQYSVHISMLSRIHVHVHIELTYCLAELPRIKNSVVYPLSGFSKWRLSESVYSECVLRLCKVAPSYTSMSSLISMLYLVSSVVLQFVCVYSLSFCWPYLLLVCL